MKLIICLASSILLSACASIVPVASKTETVRNPELNVKQTQELGNTLVSYILSTSKPSIQIPTGPIRKNGQVFETQILKPLGTIGDRFSKYIIEHPPSGYDWRDICFDNQHSSFFLPNTLGVCDSIGSSISSQESIDIKHATYVDLAYPQVRQELIYNGKSGNTVKFMYREMSGGYLRSPFTQEIQYDLEAGSIIGFKGARIEIEKSTNQIIEYRILRYFDAVQ